MRTKVKVKVTDLIAQIEARKAEAIAAHAEVLRAHPTKVAEWKKCATEKLQAALAAVKRGELPEKAGSPSTYFYLPQLPEKPAKGPNVDTFDRAIARLKLSVDEFISIDDEEYGRYVR